jgi:hypothetical protein
MESDGDTSLTMKLGRIELVPVRPTKAARGWLKGIDTSVPRDADRV